MKKQIHKFWPLTNPIRKNQEIAFDWLENQTNKYLILESPVGSGKSALAITYARYLNQGNGNSFILTPQVLLQQQYENSFSKSLIFSLYGKTNYYCKTKKTNCSLGDSIYPKCDNCIYKSTLGEANYSSNLVMNYTLALIHFAYLPFLGKRQLMILDEAHTLEKELVEFESVIYTKANCKKYGIDFKFFTNIEKAFAWIHEKYSPQLFNMFSDMKDKFSEINTKKTLTPDDVEFLKEFEKLKRHISSLKKFFKYSLDEVKEEFILVHSKNKIQFKRLFADKQFNSIIEPKADKFLFMSSTILGKDEFCRDLGIDPDEASFLSLNSEFEAEKRPVFYMPTMKMNAKWKLEENKQGRENYIKKVIEITDMHESESGIIHSGNFEVAKWLSSELNKKIPQRIFHHNPTDDESVNRNIIINRFMEYNKPSILISPSITEGLDLKNDLSRFAVFSKIPFGYLGDQWIKARLDLSNEWYRRKAIIDVIQGCGRIVRSEDDWGYVYMLDSSWNYLFSQMQHKIPNWWINAYAKIDD